MNAQNVPVHDWQVTPQQAVEIQRRLALQVIKQDVWTDIRTVCGVDVGFEQGGAVTRAAAVLLYYPGLALREFAVAKCATSFPYIPGLLSFREVPAILQALAKLRATPDLILCDGQGYAHPRRLGAALHNTL